VFEDVARLTAEAGATLFADEVYRLLEHDPGDRLSAGAEMPGGVSLGVMSKPFGLAGLRVGWLASRDRHLLARCARVKDYTTICNAGPSEILALVGLRARDALLKRALHLVVPNRDVVDGFLPEHGFSWVRPLGGSTGYARLPDSLPSAEAFCDELVRAEGLLLLPSTVFEHGDRHVRIGLGRPGLHENLERLARFLSPV
jgi:aspartate/methionine/tyrosine aminotransferase